MRMMGEMVLGVFLRLAQTGLLNLCRSVHFKSPPSPNTTMMS